MSLWNESLNTFAAIWLETLVRVCWQGGLALALVWTVCRLLPRLPAAGRCWLWRLAYLKLLFALLWLPTLDLPLLPPADQAPAVAFQPSPTTPAEAAIAVDSLPADSTATDSPRIDVTPAVAPTVAGWLLLLWTAILLWQVGQAIRQSLTVRRLRRSGAPLNGGPLDFWNLALSRDLNLTSVPRLLSSTATDTPLLIGIFRPCIVLPESLLSTCTPDELRLILAHELAHVRRRDLLWGWLPLLARFVCGFHPLVCLAERELGMAQEIACDETALHLTGAASAAYGSLLVRVAARFAPRPSHGFGMIGMTESYHTLKRRLSAMKSFPTAPRHYRVAVRFSLLTLGLAALIPWRVAAQATPPAPTTPPAVLPPVPTSPATAPTVPQTPTTPSALPAVPATPPIPTVPATPPAVVPAIPSRTTPPAAPSVVPVLPTPSADPTVAPAVSALPAATVGAFPAQAPTALPAAADGPTVSVTPAPASRRSARRARKSATANSRNGATSTVGVVVQADPTATSTVTVSRNAATRSAVTVTQHPSRASTVTIFRNASPATATTRVQGTPSVSIATVSRRASAGSTVIVSRSPSTIAAPQGYPEAAPGMISPARQAPTTAPPPADTSSGSIGITGHGSRISVTPRPTAAVRALPNPRAQSAATPTVTPTPTRAASDPLATPSPRQGRRRPTNDPLTPPTPLTPAPAGRAPADPFVRPPATAPVEPTATPALPPGIPTDPNLPQAAPPKALPADPGATPPVSLPAPKASGSQGMLAPAAPRGIPVLENVPILGRLFRIETPLQPGALQLSREKIAVPLTISREIPVLGRLPIVGRLFRFTPPVASDGQAPPMLR